MKLFVGKKKKNIEILFISFQGLGEPSYFYVENCFVLNGMMMSMFFLFGTYLR